MSRRRVQATIPVPTLDPQSMYESIMSMKELVEVLAGQRGNRTEWAVTYGDQIIDDTNKWQAPGFVNSWTDYGAPYSPCGVRKLPNGLCIMRGLTAGGSSTHICTLPKGYRPATTMLYIAETSPNVQCRLDLGTDGTLGHTGGNNGWISLCNICFLAEN